MAVDYVNFVRLDGRMYVTGPAYPLDVASAGQLGRRIGVVRCNLPAIEPDLSYRAQDGDAGFLPPGTPVYAVGGYPMRFRIATPIGSGRYRIYEVDTDPAARRGADLLPIAGKVTAVEILDGNTATQVLGKTTDHATIQAVVAGIQDAPVDQNRRTNSVPLFVRFHLTDGTAVERAWHRAEGLLERGIELPRRVAAMLEALLPRAGR